MRVVETVEPVVDVNESSGPGPAMPHAAHGRMGGGRQTTSSSGNDPIAGGVRQPVSPHVGQFINEFFTLAADIEQSLIASGENKAVKKCPEL